MHLDWPGVTLASEDSGTTPDNLVILILLLASLNTLCPENTPDQSRTGKRFADCRHARKDQRLVGVLSVFASLGRLKLFWVNLALDLVELHKHIIGLWFLLKKLQYSYHTQNFM